MHVGYVVPRYGLEVVGGAETGARMFAERLVSDLGWSVEIFTTCALDAMTWSNEYAEGSLSINGVTVHRFRSVLGRHPDFHGYSGPLLSRVSTATMDEADHWIDLQGPRCPRLLDALAESEAELLVFYPYLYYPTVRGLLQNASRSVMHPAAHDEAPLRLPVFKEVFAQSRGLVFQTFGERRLVHSLFPVASTPQVVLGLGVEEQAGEAKSNVRSALGIGDRPFLLSIGRVDDQKGSGVLWRYFLTYKERHPGDLALVLAGQIVDAPPKHPDLIVPGIIDDRVKWGLLRSAMTLVNPSPHEAFSIVVIEGWTAGIPVVVNARCAATREHCERSDGGLWFESYADFELVLEHLLDSEHRTQLARNGQRYVDTNFRWPLILDRYSRFLSEVAVRQRVRG